MKPPKGFELANSGLVIGKHVINSFLFIITKQYIKYLPYQLNMINKIYLHPIITSGYSNSVSSCHVLICSTLSNRNSLYLKLKHLSWNIFLNSGFSIPYLTILKIFKLPSTGDKKDNMNLVFFFFLIFFPPHSASNKGN